MMACRSSAPAIHADLHLSLAQDTDEGMAGKLAALLGVEGLGHAAAGHGTCKASTQPPPFMVFEMR